MFTFSVLLALLGLLDSALGAAVTLGSVWSIFLLKRLKVPVNAKMSAFFDAIYSLLFVCNEKQTAVRKARQNVSNSEFCH